jgi:ABC-2 type transport system permease protein
MNMQTPRSQSNAVPESSLDARGMAPAVERATRPFYWSVRRELWENRSIYIAPLAGAGVFLLAFAISLTRKAHAMQSLMALDAAKQHDAITMPYHLAAGLMMAIALVVGVFYSLEALHWERRDRSILFWKSLPVSDVTTVLSKATIPLVILPLLTVAITAAVQFIMLLLSSAVLAAHGLSVSTYWAQVSWLQMSMGLFYHLFTVHVLLHAPFYCWFLLVSAWARRAAFLWAFLPPLAIGVVEKIAFNTQYFVDMLGAQLSGGSEAVPMAGRMPIDPGMQFTPGHFLLTPGLWIGLAVGAAFLAGAVRLRHTREPI